MSLSAWWQATRQGGSNNSSSDAAGTTMASLYTTYKSNASPPTARYTRAITLPYKVAPAPTDYEAVLAAVLLQVSDTQAASSGNSNSNSGDAAVSPTRNGTDEATAVSVGTTTTMASLLRGVVVGTVRRLELKGTLASRQRFFDEHFARQLDGCACEAQRVLCSGVCALLTGGRVCHGSVFVTNAALYFTTDRVPLTTAQQQRHGSADDEDDANDMMAAAAVATGPSLYMGSYSNAHRQLLQQQRRRTYRDDNDDATTSAATAARAAMRQPLRVRERVAFARVASVLPSIACNVRTRSSTRSTDGDDAVTGAAADAAVCGVASTAPYVMGVPCSLVVPNALQLFAVAPQQVFQLTRLRHVCYAAPLSSSSSAADASGACRGDGDACGSGDVWTASEHAVLRAVPCEHDMLVFAAFVMRVWRRRLRQLGQPELHPLAEYADPH